MQDPDFLARYGAGTGKYYKAEFLKYLSTRDEGTVGSELSRASLFFQREALKEIKIVVDTLNSIEGGLIDDKTRDGYVKEFSQVGFNLDRANFLLAEAIKSVEQETNNPGEMHVSFFTALKKQNTDLVKTANQIVQDMAELAIRLMGEGDGRTMMYELTNNAKVYRKYLINYFHAQDES
jgi:hypothetical protein